MTLLELIDARAASAHKAIKIWAREQQDEITLRFERIAIRAGIEQHYQNAVKQHRDAVIRLNRSNGQKRRHRLKRQLTGEMK